jgi:CrcB protein
MSRLLIVAVGGALGSAARYLLSGFVQTRTTPYFPTGTLAVNVLGSLLVGLVAGAASANVASPNARLFLVVGVCGGFTTFSAFSYETLRLLQDNELWQAGLNAGGQLVAGLVAVWVGLAMARAFWGASR